jgi:hypothetical protein
MKKSTLFLACCIGLMLFASCKKDPVAPTINVITDTGYVTENAQIYSGDIIKVGFNATGEKLTKIEITLTQNGTVINSSQTTIENQTSFSHTAAFTVEATGTVTVTGTVTDANGLTGSKSFNINYNEKPNAKFIGHYEGNALATGSYQAEVSGLEPVQQEFTDREVPVILDIAAGDDINKIVATCTIDDRTMTALGTVEGDKITFETINDVITFDYDLGIMVIHPEINVTYSIVSTLVDGRLNLEGNCTGNGVMNYGFFSGNINLEATVGGSLNKKR